MFIRRETLSAHSARPSKIPGWIVTILVNEGVPQKTKEATSYAVKVFEGKETLRKFSGEQ